MEWWSIWINPNSSLVVSRDAEANQNYVIKMARTLAVCNLADWMQEAKKKDRPRDAALQDIGFFALTGTGLMLNQSRNPTRLQKISSIFLKKKRTDMSS